jgi:hypothetical protein
MLYFILQHYKKPFIFHYKNLVKERKEYPIIQYMDFLKKIKNFNFEKTGFNEKLLHNTYILYFIAFLSFGKFFFELMVGDMYYVTVYIIIAFLLSFFNKNMIIILFFSLVFANILKYGGASTVEGFDHEDSSNEDASNEDASNEVEKALGVEHKNNDEGVIDEIVGEDHKEKEKKDNKEKNNKDKEKKKEKKTKNHESDDEDEDEPKKKNKKNKHHDDLDEELDKNEKLLKNQQLLLKNMKEYKPFLDTIQGLAKNVSGFVKKDSE